MNIDETMNTGNNGQDIYDDLSTDESDFDFDTDFDSESVDSDFSADADDFDIEDDFDSDFEEVTDKAQYTANDPDSPEALTALMEELKQKRSDLYNNLSQAKTAAYCVDTVLALEPNQTIRDAIRFAACTTIAGGEYYYVHNRECTVTCDVSKKKPSEHLAQTIMDNIQFVSSSFTNVLCKGCRDYKKTECYVPLSDFGSEDTMRHEPCKCVIDKEGNVVKRDADEDCPTCNGGASVNESSCDNCKHEAKNLEEYIERVKECLILQGNDGLGWEVESVIRKVADTLLDIYMGYALQLKPPMGVLTDYQESSGRPYATVCRGMNVRTGTLPGTYTEGFDYTSIKTHYTYNLDKLSLIVKEAACSVAALRGAGAQVTGLAIAGKYKQSLSLPFFGHRDARTSLNLYGDSRYVKLNWDDGKKRFVSAFSAGGWHSYHVFGVHSIGTNNLKSMYTAPSVTEEAVTNADGGREIKRKVTPLSFDEQVCTQIRNDIREQMWGFIRDNAKRVVSKYPLKLWSGEYKEFEKYTLDDLIKAADDSANAPDLQYVTREMILDVVREILCYLLTTVIDYIMTFVVVHDCNASNITFDLVHFAYKTRDMTGGLMCLGTAMNDVFRNLFNPTRDFTLRELNAFGEGLRDMHVANMISAFDGNRDSRGEITSGTPGGLSKLGTVYVSKYIMVSNPTAYLGYPLFAYEPISRMQKLSGQLDRNSILIGETMQGAKVELKNLLSHWCECVSLFAASRSGKGVMTLAMLGTLLQSGNPVVYLDGKPEMSGVLVDFILSLNEIAKTLNPSISDSELINTFPAFEFFQPCVENIRTGKKANSTYCTKMSETARKKMCKMQAKWLACADGTTSQGKFDELWRKHFCGDKSSVSNSVKAPPFGADGVSPTFSYLLRMKAYYLFYAMNKTTAVYENCLHGQRIIVISDEVNRCNISAGYEWLGNFACALKAYTDKLKKSSDDAARKNSENAESLKQEYAIVSRNYNKFMAFVSDYFGKLNFNATTSGGNIKLSSMSEADAGLVIQSAIQKKQEAEAKVAGTNEGASPLYILIGQDGSEIYSGSGGRIYSSAGSKKDSGYTQWGTTLETYLMRRAVDGKGVCIQGNWTGADNNAYTDYHQAMIKGLREGNFAEVKSKYLHYINDGSISGFFAIKQGAAMQIARTYLVLNNNTAEYTEDYNPASGETKNNVRPRTYAAILGDSAKDKNKQKEVDAVLDNMLFSNYEKLLGDDLRDESRHNWKREARVGFLGYFGMLIDVDLPDHVFDVRDVRETGTCKEDSNKDRFKADSLTDADKERFWRFFNTFKQSCESLDEAFRAMPFVQYMAKRGRVYNSIQDFIYDCDPMSFIPLSAMLATSDAEIEQAISGVNDLNSEYADMDAETLRAKIDESAITDEAAQVADVDIPNESFEPLNFGNTSSMSTPNSAPTSADASSEFVSLFNTTIKQFDSIERVLKNEKARDSYARLVIQRGKPDVVLETLDKFYTEVMKLIDKLDNEYTAYLANPMQGSSITYDEALNNRIDAYGAIANTWITARKQYHGR